SASSEHSVETRCLSDSDRGNEGVSLMKRNKIFLLSFCLTTMAAVAPAHVAGPRAQALKSFGNIVVHMRLKGVAPPSSEPAPQRRQSQPKAENKPPQFDNEQYQFGLLTRGPKWTAENTPEIQKIQEGHMANIAKMAQAGKLFAAGPMLDNGDLRGIFVFNTESAEEAKAWAETDPAVK